MVVYSTVRISLTHNAWPMISSRIIINILSTSSNFPSGPEISDWRITVGNEHPFSLAVSWGSPPAGALNGSQVEEFIVLCASSNQPFTHVRKVPPREGNATIQYLRPFTKYRVQVIAVRKSDGYRQRSVPSFIRTVQDGK